MPPDIQPDNMEKDRQLRSHAHAVHLLFDRILSDVYTSDVVVHRLPTLFMQQHGQRPTSTLRDLQDEFEQFRIWTRNIGVFAPDNGSLDYRLRDAAEVREGLLALLRSLASHLTNIEMLLQQDRNCDDTRSCCSESDYDESSSDVDEDDLPSETEDTSSTSTATELQYHLCQVPSLVTKLLHLARVIRVTGISSRQSKAAHYEHWEGDVNQTAIFEGEYLARVLKTRFGLSEPLFSRIHQAICIRRRQFMYQARHQKRLAYDATAIAVTRSAPPPLPGTTTGNEQQASELKHKVAACPPPRPPGGRSAITHHTKATTVNLTQLKRLAPSTMVASTARLALLGAEIPPPPEVAAGASHFECPYCCLLIERHRSEQTAWRRHVLNDLQPFICIEPSCTEPSIVLESMTAWVDHHRCAHTTEWWCDGLEEDHDPIRFTKAEDYSDHLVTAHLRSLSMKQCEDRVGAAAIPSQDTFTCCPFCDWCTINLSNNISHLEHGELGPLRTRAQQTRLQAHIFDHLLSMFLLALPPRQDLDDAGLAGSTFDTSSGVATRSSIVSLLQDFAEKQTQIPATALNLTSVDPAMQSEDHVAAWLGVSPPTVDGVYLENSLNSLPQLPPRLVALNDVDVRLRSEAPQPDTPHEAFGSPPATHDLGSSTPEDFAPTRDLSVSSEAKKSPDTGSLVEASGSQSGHVPSLVQAWDKVEKQYPDITLVGVFKAETEQFQKFQHMQMLQAQEQSAAIKQAFKSFGISEDDPLADDDIIDLFKGLLADLPHLEGELRHHLHIIGSWRQSSDILAVADDAMDTHEQALQFLEADATISDDFIQALYISKISEHPENKILPEQAKKAVRIIAQHRNSMLLNRFINSGFSGDLMLDAADALNNIQYKSAAAHPSPFTQHKTQPPAASLSPRAGTLKEVWTKTPITGTAGTESHGHTETTRPLSSQERSIFPHTSRTSVLVEKANSKSSKIRYPCAADWETVKPLIAQLYVAEKRKLREVVRIIEQRHHFLATEAMYKTRLRKWGMFRNSRGATRQHDSNAGGNTSQHEDSVLMDPELDDNASVISWFYR